LIQPCERLHDKPDSVLDAALLWTAPELMASQLAGVVGLSTGTQKGDVYSFGVIVHEILYRAGLFRSAEDELSMPAKSTSDYTVTQ